MRDFNMNILVIAQYFPPDMGGASTRIFNIIKGIRNKNCKIYIITAFPHYPDAKNTSKYIKRPFLKQENKNVTIFRVWIPPISHNRIVSRVILHLMFIFTSLFVYPYIKDIDIIYAANPNLFSFYSALLYSFLRNIPIVRNVDDLWPEVFYEMNIVKNNALIRLFDSLSGLTYKLSKNITPICNNYKKIIINKYKIDKNKINVIEVGIDHVEKLTEKIRYDNSKPYNIIYSGILGAGYDFEFIIRVSSLINNKNVKFYIRGIGPEYNKIKNLINKNKISNIELDSKFISKQQLKEYLEKADAFILPMKEDLSAVEGLSTKIFEYQSFGRPIICISKGDAAEYIKKTRSGIVVNQNDYEGCINAINYLYNNRESADEMGKNGYTYLKNNLTSELIGNKLYSIFSRYVN